MDNGIRVATGGPSGGRVRVANSEVEAGKRVGARGRELPACVPLSAIMNAKEKGEDMIANRVFARPSDPG